MRYVIGVDCGGTKTEAHAYSVDGLLLASANTGFGNLVVDYNKGLKHIIKAVMLIFDQLPKKDCIEITFGIAGIDSGGLKEQASQELQKIHDKILILNDGQLAHYSILKGYDGVTITAGTGSVVLGLDKETWFRVGGWGHLFGDEGSAYTIAKKGIQQSLEEYDSGLEPSVLTQKIFGHFKVKNVFELPQKVYALNNGELAELAILIASLAQVDAISKKIIEQTGVELAFAVKKIIKKMPSKNKWLVGLNGSVVEKNKVILEVLKDQLSKENLQFEFYKKTESCTKGAYYLYQRNGEK